VLSEGVHGSPVVALGSGYGLESLYMFSGTATATDLAVQKNGTTGAVSPNGRFVAWVEAPCSAKGNAEPAVVTLINTPGATTRTIALPAGWTEVGVVNLTVGSAGGIALLASHTQGENCGTLPHAGPASALLDATAGASSFHVVRTSRNPAVVSPNGRQRGFACSNCAFSNSGAVFDDSGVSGQRLVSSHPAASVRLPTPTGVTYSLLGNHSDLNGTSPTGASVLVSAETTAHLAGHFGELVPGHTHELLLWHPGEQPTVIPVPGYLANSDLNGGVWLTPSVVVDLPLVGSVFGVTQRVVLFDPITRHWGPMRVFPSRQTKFEYCALPTGKVLVAAGPDIAGTAALQDAKLYVSSGTNLVEIRTGLRAIAGISCPPGPDVYVSAGGRLYAVNGATVTPHWTVAASSVGQSGTSGGDKFTQLSAGRATACGLEADGKAVCWGVDKPGASDVPNKTFTQVAAGDDYACGLQSDGQVDCWGEDASGTATPVPHDSFSQVATQGDFTCGLKVGGNALCWGHSLGGTPTSTQVFTQITTTNALFACGLQSSGAAVCWGSGLDTFGPPQPPASAAFTQITAGAAYACGLESDGSAVCWGRAVDGPSIAAPSRTFKQISAGYGTACGLEEDGTAACWGSNAEGGATPPALKFTQIAEGNGFGCGIQTSGTTVCWGSITKAE
jgi:Regulator of chromosome condensation (RCC1) repeat